MTEQNALDLIAAVNGLSAVLGVFVSPDAMFTLLKGALLAWVAGLGVGLGLRYLAKLG